jgi:hypothetical protein
MNRGGMIRLCRAVTLLLLASMIIIWLLSLSGIWFGRQIQSWWFW